MKKFVSSLVIAGLMTSPSFSAFAEDRPNPPAPTPVDTGPARNEGYRDGMAAGQQEGRNQGQADGRFRGSSEGEAQGFRQCAEDLARRERDRGHADGYREGSYEGERNGRDRGAIEGRDNGLREGRASGVRRAQSDAERDATPPGAAQGRDEAEHSDAAARGARDGYAEGESDARKDAVAKDFPRGRQAVRDEMERDAVQSEDQFSQLGTQRAESSAQSDTAFASMLSKLTRLKAVFNIQREYPTPEERAAYQEGYRSGHDAGYKNAYDETYRRTYREAFDQGKNRGCQKAREKSYREDYDRGYREGRSEGYDRAYRSAYDYAYRSAYDPAFRQADEQAYGENYADFYHRAFEAARARAYAERTGQLYRAAYNTAYEARYAEVRPGFGEEEYQRGRREETLDFQQRPVRLLEASVNETNGNSLIEPEETLRLRLKLRNFSAMAIDARQVTLQINALDENSVIVSTRQMTLAQGLKAKSVTTVTDAFELLIKDAAVGRASRVQLKVLIGDKSAGEQTLTIQANYAVQALLAEAPAFRDGLETVLKVSIKNISGAATEPTLKVSLNATHPDLQVPTTEQIVAGLAPGESRIVEFPLITRTSEESIQLPLIVGIQGGNDAKQRKIGGINQAQAIPVISDYKIVLLSADSLRQAGSSKLKYQIQNNGSDNINRKLNVRLGFPKAENPNDFTPVGTYPLELVKIIKGGALKLGLPVRVNRANSGGIAELQLFEGSKLLLIHRYQF